MLVKVVKIFAFLFYLAVQLPLLNIFFSVYSAMTENLLPDTFIGYFAAVIFLLILLFPTYVIIPLLNSRDTDCSQQLYPPKRGKAYQFDQYNMGIKRKWGMKKYAIRSGNLARYHARQAERKKSG